MWLLQIIIVNSFLYLAQCDEEEGTIPRIAIVGAGLSGTSTAFHLRQLFGAEAQIDVYEADRVGGRTAVISIDGKEYEAGGSIIHKKNRYMVEFASRFNKSANGPSSDNFFGLYDDSGILFETSRWQIVTIAKMVLRYGLDLYTLQSWTSNLILNKFERIYDFQERGIAFTTVEDMLRAMSEDFVNMTHYSLEEVLSQAGFSQSFISELAMAAMRTNYGQTVHSHGFVGAVSLVGAEPGLWSVLDGNFQIAASLLKESKATLVKATVTSVTLNKDELGIGSVSYDLEYQIDSGDKEKASSKEYDIVVMAAPIFGTRKKVSFVDFPNPVTSFSQDYHTTIAMFVQGSINASTFHLSNKNDFPPSLFAISPNLFFNCIGLQTPVSGESKGESDGLVWKTFLNQVPTKDQVMQLFESYQDLRLVDWLAYPEYKPNMDLPPFMLYDRLYYVNAIESAASAMEMSVIGGRNVALLAFNQWHGYFDKIDEINLPSTSEKDRTDL